MSRIIGIDLGTTNSLCAVFEGGEPQLVPNALGEFLTPSVVGVLPSGEVIVGAAAKELAITRPDHAVACFKRWMGSDQQATLGDRSFGAIELSSLVLRSLCEDAANAFGERVEEAVITVPAYFNDAQRTATRRAGELAGLRVRRIVNEPTAAALAYGFHDRDAEKHLLVIDLGGGTFDVTLMEVFEGTLEIVASAGESQLGGEDFTSRIVAEVLKREGRQLERAEFESPLLVSRLRQDCERGKRAFAEGGEVTIRVPGENGEFSEAPASHRLATDEFREVARPLLDRVRGPIDRVLRDGDVPAEAVDEVLLVGGATRMPVLRDLVEERFGRPGLARFDPDRVVALGAAVQAALIADDRAVDDMVMTDVCPFTLGVNTSKSFGAEVRDGYFTPVINRNTTIPVSREMPFQTTQAFQKHVLVEVYQGEHRRVEKNIKLGEVVVDGIPPGPAGQALFIRFTYDLNGILEVEAYAEGQENRKTRAVLTQHAAALGPDELAAAVDRMKDLKFYPREDQETQRLLRQAEGIVGEVSPLQREPLEAAIDALEAAMAMSDKPAVQSACETLVMVLSSLGYEA